MTQKSMLYRDTAYLKTSNTIVHLAWTGFFAHWKPIDGHCSMCISKFPINQLGTIWLFSHTQYN